MIQNLFFNSIFAAFGDSRARNCKQSQLMVNTTHKTTIENLQELLTRENESLLKEIQFLLTSLINIDQKSIKYSRLNFKKISKKQKFLKRKRDYQECEQIYVDLFKNLTIRYIKYVQFVEEKLTNFLEGISKFKRATEFLPRFCILPAKKLNFSPITISELGDFIEKCLKSENFSSRNANIVEQFELLHQKNIFTAGYGYILLHHLLGLDYNPILFYFNFSELKQIKKQIKKINSRV